MSTANDVGARLLDDVRSEFSRFCIMPTDHTLTAVVLWIAAAHMVAEFHFAPRLVVRSAEKRSGKTRLLELAAELVPYEPLRMANATLAYVFRSLAEDPPPTILFDEADTVFGTKKVAEQNEDLRALFNAGFQRGTPIGRTTGPNHTPTKFEVFAFAALAGIGRMPDTIEDRAVVIPMRRRKSSEKVSAYRARRDSPKLHILRDRLAIWADQVRAVIRDHEPENLGIDDRAADVWEPLVAVADMAGGDWPGKARAAAAAMVESAEEDEADSQNVRLLADIRDVFGDLAGVSFLKSAALCDELRKLADSPWLQYDLNPSRLGIRLRDYQVKTKHNTAKTERGYHLDDFQDAFDRYLQPPEDPEKPQVSVLKVSEGVPSRPQAVDQHQQPDALKPPDTLKASGQAKASHQNPSSNGTGTPSDTFGHHGGEKSLCEACNRAPARRGTTLCDLCTAKATASSKGGNAA